jgi:hypothetical protein
MEETMRLSEPSPALLGALIVMAGCILLGGCEKPQPGMQAAAKIMQESGPVTSEELARLPWATTAFKGWSDEAVADYATIVRLLEDLQALEESRDMVLAMVQSEMQTLLSKVPDQALKQHAIRDLEEAVLTLVDCHRLRRDYGDEAEETAAALEETARSRLQDGRIYLRVYGTRGARSLL